jgi:hypothetical protein
MAGKDGWKDLVAAYKRTNAPDDPPAPPPDDSDQQQDTPTAAWLDPWRWEIV